MKVSEATIGRALVSHLQADGWDVYQEVTCEGSIADVVATRAHSASTKLVAVYECKTTLTFEVIAQACHWRGLANWIYVAVPAAECGGIGRQLAIDVCVERGLGVIEVWNGKASLTRAPSLLRRAYPTLLNALRPEHKTHAVAGTQAGGRWTPFSSTCKLIREYLVTHPDAPVAEVMRAIKHHYTSDSSAQSSIVHWARAGQVPGVEVMEGRPLRFRLTPASAQRAPEQCPHLAQSMVTS